MGTAANKWGGLQNAERSYRSASLHHWARHIRGDIAKALEVLAPMQSALVSPDYKCLEDWFKLGLHHSFYQPPAKWITLTETQVMSGLCYFTNELGVGAGQALMQALSPKFPAAECDQFACEVETPIVGALGRIDLVLRADSVTKSYYTVVEAKLGSSLESNPLSKYRSHVTNQMTKANDEINFIVLDFGEATKTTKRLNRNKDWRLLSWFLFMSRLEKRLQECSVHDHDYMQFRRMIWDRI